MERIQKEHKKLGKGLSELWKCIITHLNQIVEIDNLLDEMNFSFSGSNSGSEMNQLIE